MPQSNPRADFDAFGSCAAEQVASGRAGLASSLLPFLRAFRAGVSGYPRRMEVKNGMRQSGVKLSDQDHARRRR